MVSHQACTSFAMAFSWFLSSHAELYQQICPRMVQPKQQQGNGCTTLVLSEVLAHLEAEGGCRCLLVYAWVSLGSVALTMLPAPATAAKSVGKIQAKPVWI